VFTRSERFEGCTMELLGDLSVCIGAAMVRLWWSRIAVLVDHVYDVWLLCSV